MQSHNVPPLLRRIVMGGTQFASTVQTLLVFFSTGTASLLMRHDVYAVCLTVRGGGAAKTWFAIPRYAILIQIRAGVGRGGGDRQNVQTSLPAFQAELRKARGGGWWLGGLKCTGSLPLFPAKCVPVSVKATVPTNKVRVALVSKLCARFCCMGQCPFDTRRRVRTSFDCHITVYLKKWSWRPRVKGEKAACREEGGSMSGIDPGLD